MLPSFEPLRGQRAVHHGEGEQRPATRGIEQTLPGLKRGGSALHASQLRLVC